MNEHGFDGLQFDDRVRAYQQRPQAQPTNGNVVEMPTASSPKWPEPLSLAAFHGIAGEYVNLVDPASETDRAALLLQFLVAAGNCVGHHPYYLTEDTPHYLNLYVVLIGLTSKRLAGEE
jgi:hypothetical protein